MLMKPRKSLLDRPWVLPALMGGVLAAGIGLGVGIGVFAKPDPPPLVLAGDNEFAPPPATLPPPEDDGPLEVAAFPPPRPRPAETAAEPPQQQQTAALLAPPPPRAAAAAKPAWVRFAVTPPKAAGRPMIAVVIDDLGVDRHRTERVAALKGPLTLAYLTYADDLDRQTEAARGRGHELLVHVPMQPVNGAFDAGPGALTVDLPPDEVRRRLGWGLSRFKGFVGVNNHMGSRFTADPAGMRVVMEELSRRGLMFLDSVTTEKSVADEAARRQQVPFVARQVFLDNQQSVASVRAQLEKTEAWARRHGAAIAIGHPHDATLEALAAWLPTLESRGFVLVPVTTMVKAAGH
jgi:polysaccharide deacetylase 2 family uncharacterized protein YibQ